MNIQLTIPTAEPFLFTAGRTGCLLVHGFTGTPKEMRWLGEYLAEQGHTVLGIRLAGHATQLPDMVRTRWWDWMASIEDGLNILKCSTDRIYILGLSMGGVLSLLSAARYPINGVVAMSTPYSLPQDWRMKLIHILKWLKPEFSKEPPDWHNPNAGQDHVSYPIYPTRSIAELAELMAEMRKTLPLVSIPVMLIQSRQDTSISTDSMQSIYDHLGTSNKETLWLDNSGHVLTREPDREILFNAIAHFIYRVNEKQ